MRGSTDLKTGKKHRSHLSDPPVNTGDTTKPLPTNTALIQQEFVSGKFAHDVLTFCKTQSLRGYVQQNYKKTK